MTSAAPSTAAARQRAALVALVLLSSVGCDRVTKDYAQAVLPGAGRISLAGDILRIEYAENRGAFLGMGASLSAPVRRALFIVGNAGIALFTVLAALWGSDRARSEVAALSLVAGGGLGNLWDRIAHGGSVVDFLNLGIGPVRTGIFNVADLAIVAGVALLALGHRGARPVRKRGSLDESPSTTSAPH